MTDKPHTTDEPLWRGPVSLTWRDDEYGKKDRALHIGGIQVGHIMQWSGKDSPRVGEWRAWLNSDSDGRHLGWYPTEQEAKDKLVDEVLKEITK